MSSGEILKSAGLEVEDGGNGAAAFNSIHSDVIKGFRVSNEVRGFFRDCCSSAESHLHQRGEIGGWWESFFSSQEGGLSMGPSLELVMYPLHLGKNGLGNDFGKIRRPKGGGFVGRLGEKWLS